MWLGEVNITGLQTLVAVGQLLELLLRLRHGGVLRRGGLLQVELLRARWDGGLLLWV